MVPNFESYQDWKIRKDFHKIVITQEHLSKADRWQAKWILIEIGLSKLTWTTASLWMGKCHQLLATYHLWRNKVFGWAQFRLPAQPQVSVIDRQSMIQTKSWGLTLVNKLEALLNNRGSPKTMHLDWGTVLFCNTVLSPQCQPSFDSKSRNIKHSKGNN